MESAIREIIETVWATVLDLTVVCRDKAEREAFMHTLAGCVQFTGAWQGTVILSCSPALARFAASRVFHIVPENVTIDQAQDALSELINITGGNLKALLPGRSYLSLPTVVEGIGYILRIPGSHLVAEVHFESQGHRFAVTLLERDEQNILEFSHIE